MLLPCHAAPRLSKRLTALLIDSSTEGDPCLLGELCISNFQGLARLSLWDSLRSSTQEGRVVPGWPMHLEETLLPWKSKDKKCGLYKMPYVAAPVRVLSDVIAKFSPLHVTNFGRTYKNQKFFLVLEQQVSQGTCLCISRLLHIFFTRRSKVVPERTTYCITWGVPQRVPSNVSSSRLRSDVSSWATPLRNIEDQDDRKKGTLSNQPQLTCVTPTVLLGSWVLQQIKDVMSLGTNFETHAKWQGSVEEPNAMDFVAKKVCTKYRIEQSWRNSLERN